MMRTWYESDQGFLVECRGVKLALDNGIKEVSTVEESVSVVLKRFEDVFEWSEQLPPRRDIEHHIHLKKGTNTVNVRPYRYAYQQKAEMASGAIHPSTSPYSSPVLLVKKKDGSRRFCDDYKALNNVTIPDKFHIPTIEELFNELNGASMFSKIDLKAGYHQICMCTDDVEKTAFRTHESHREFMAMPFGLTNAPTTFQSLMNTIFRPYLRKFVLVFFDDVLIYSRELEEHLQHLGFVLEVLKKDEFYANKKKCNSARTQVEYMGHIISDLGVEVDPEKIRAIREWPIPTNFREVRGFLGLIRYYQKFVQHYGILAAPLTHLLKLGGFKWMRKLKRPSQSCKML